MKKIIRPIVRLLVVLLWRVGSYGRRMVTPVSSHAQGIIPMMLMSGGVTF